MSTEKNLCNAMREEWRMLYTLIQNVSQILNKLLNLIRSLINRIVNSYLSAIAATLRDIKDIVAAYLGLSAIDTASARQEFCRLLYNCKPAMDIVMRNYDKSLYKWLYEQDSFETPDLSKWGIPSIKFNSKYEVFEYAACRLSLNSLYNSFIDTLINNLMNFLNDYKKYASIDWFLEHTWLGKFLARQMKDYEEFFKDHILKYMDMMLPYLNCAFAMCDFGLSTTNFMEDFKTKYKIGKNNIHNPLDNWVLFKDDMLSGMKYTMDQMIADIEEIVPSEMISNPEQPQSKATTPYNGDEQSRQESNKNSEMISVLSPSKTNKKYSREVTTHISPTSIGTGLG